MTLQCRLGEQHFFQRGEPDRGTVRFTEPEACGNDGGYVLVHDFAPGVVGALGSVRTFVGDDRCARCLGGDLLDVGVGLGGCGTGASTTVDGDGGHQVVQTKAGLIGGNIRSDVGGQLINGDLLTSPYLACVVEGVYAICRAHFVCRVDTGCVDTRRETVGMREEVHA